MVGEHHSNIFSLAFDSQNSRIYSGGNDDQVLVHDIHRKDTLDVFLHEDAVYGLAVDPRDSHIFTSACADGRVLLWDTRVPSHQEPIVIASSETAFYAVVYHPVEPEFIATANSKEGVALWDLRVPKSCLVRYGSTYTQQSAMSVRFNQLGTRLVALRRRLPPVVYNVHSSAAAVQFNHSGYYNSCTMKSCTFAGDKDQYVLSGSDDFNLYMWEVPEPSEDVMWVDEAKLVLQGHRSIVNQVRFNAFTHNIVSSGVEKIIKLWSPFTLPNIRPDEDSPRRMFSHQQYIDLVINSGSALSHDYSDQSMEEDPRMIAFFDSLVQREINRSFSDSDDSDMSPESLYLHFAGEGDDSEDSRDSESGSSISSMHATVLSRLLRENADPSPTSQLRTLWNLTTSPRDQAAANGTNAAADRSDSNSTPGEESNIPRRAAEQDRNSASVDEVAGCSRHDESVENGTAKSNNRDSGKTASSKRKHSRHRPSSSTTSPDPSSSDEDVNFQELRARSRLLRRFLMKKKRKGGTDVDRNHQSSDLMHNDRFINLKQRMAISRVLKGKIARSEDGLSRPSTREEDLNRITEHLQQRSMASHQRLAISRMRRRLQQENSLGIGNSLGESSQTAQESVTNNSMPDQNYASCSTAQCDHHQRTPNNDSSSNTLIQPTNAATSSSVIRPEFAHSLPSFCASSTNNVLFNSQSSLGLNSTGDSSVLAGCSSRVSFSNHQSVGCSSDPATCQTPNELDQQYDSHHRNEFHKFRNQTARAKRRYRSHKEKKAADDSDTD
ncbi:DDB1- and CUL4-associated factor 5-like isoform X2 [Acanthaster planci]|nr:DDB1- and CUL4-associated factor 5-like isoform X2 [Acanthaster planci]XP_022095640.1 DDB1- and CUL4-associated factor 5-like isoform X2 [Acanthaster planci]